MSNERDYDMHDLQQDMDYLKGKVSRLVRTVHGPDDTHEPEGLVYRVGKNSAFRKNATRALWLMAGTVLTIAGYLIVNGVS